MRTSPPLAQEQAAPQPNCDPQGSRPAYPDMTLPAETPRRRSASQGRDPVIWRIRDLMIVSATRDRAQDHRSQITTSQMAWLREGIPAGRGDEKGISTQRAARIVGASLDCQVARSPNRQMGWLFAVGRAGCVMPRCAGPLPCGSRFGIRRSRSGRLFAKHHKSQITTSQMGR